jgi:uncharacterized protein
MNLESLFFVHAIDGANGPALRREYLRAHLDYVELHLHRYRIAGPLLSDGGAMNASVLIVAATSLADARALMDGDPYVASGLYRELVITPFRAAAGTWIGGKSW